MIDHISLILVTYNSTQVAEFAAETACLFKNVYVIDNNSQDETIEKFKSAIPHATILKQSENLGYGKANNLGLRLASQINDYALIMNPDCKISLQSITALFECLNANNGAVIACPVVYSTAGIQQSITRRDYSKPFSKSQIQNITTELQPQNYILDTNISGSCLLVNCRMFAEIGSFDENIFMYHEEDDVGYRAQRNGYQIITNRIASAQHLDGKSSKSNLLQELKKQYHIHYSKYYLLKKYDDEFTVKKLIAKSVISSLLLLPIYSILLSKKRILKATGKLIASISFLHK